MEFLGCTKHISKVQQLTCLVAAVLESAATEPFPPPKKTLLVAK